MNEKIEKFLALRSWVRMAHHIPGRMRLKYKMGIVAHLAGFNAQKIEHAIERFPALKSYKLTHSTGSILIEYDAELVQPAHIDALFSEDEGIAKQAYCRISESLNHNLKGENNE